MKKQRFREKIVDFIPTISLIGEKLGDSLTAFIVEKTTTVDYSKAFQELLKLLEKRPFNAKDEKNGVIYPNPKYFKQDPIKALNNGKKLVLEVLVGNVDKELYSDNELINLNLAELEKLTFDLINQLRFYCYHFSKEKYVKLMNELVLNVTKKKGETPTEETLQGLHDKMYSRIALRCLPKIYTFERVLVEEVTDFVANLVEFTDIVRDKKTDILKWKETTKENFNKSVKNLDKRNQEINSFLESCGLLDEIAYNQQSLADLENYEGKFTWKIS